MRTLALGLLVALIAAVAVSFVGPYLRFLLAQLSVVIIAVLSLNLLGNVAGMLSLASAAFMGLGGYGALILLTMYGLPLVLSVVTSRLKYSIASAGRPDTSSETCSSASSVPHRRR